MRPLVSIYLHAQRASPQKQSACDSAGVGYEHDLLLVRCGNKDSQSVSGHRSVAGWMQVSGTAAQGPCLRQLRVGIAHAACRAAICKHSQSSRTRIPHFLYRSSLKVRISFRCMVTAFLPVAMKYLSHIGREGLQYSYCCFLGTAAIAKSCMVR